MDEEPSSKPHSTDRTMSIAKIFGPSRKMPPLPEGTLIDISLPLIAEDRHSSFAVHKDLICLTSKRIRKFYVKEQKPITGTCPVCTTAFDSHAVKLDYCLGLFGSCENYIHRQCHNTWSEAIHGPTFSCVCRMPWALYDDVLVWPEAMVTRRAVEMYGNWFYTDDVGIPPDLPWGCDLLNDLFLDAWEMASTMQDDTYKIEVIGKYISREGMTGASVCDFSPKFIESIWSNNRGDDGLKDFIIDLCLTSPQSEHICWGLGAGIHPSYHQRRDGLLWALYLKIFTSVPRVKKLDDLLKKYTRGMYGWKVERSEIVAGIEKMSIVGM